MTAAVRVHVAAAPLSDRPIRLRHETDAGPLQLHADAKTTPLAHWAGDRRPVAVIPNAFALPSGPLDVGGTCPQLSPNACQACYAARLESGPFAEFARVTVRNLDTLNALHKVGKRAAVDALCALVDRSAALQIAAGVASPSFRWMSSGDIFAPWFAVVVREVQRARPGVTFWGYTRSVRYLRHLIGDGLPDNARWFVSVDADNVRTHGKAAARWGLPCAYLAATSGELARLRVAVEEMRGSVLPRVICPAGGVWKGDGLGPSYVSGRDGRRVSVAPGRVSGACVACAACLPGAAVRDVGFIRHGGAGSAAVWQRLALRRGV
jgi:hypothetical protein